MTDRPDTVYEWLAKPIPFGLTTVWLLLLIALFIVQAFAARDRGDQRWWDTLTTSVVIVGSGLAFYFGAFTSNYSGQASPPTEYFDLNRNWLLIGSLIGIPLLAVILVRDTVNLVRRRQRPLAGYLVTTFYPTSGAPPETHTEIIRAGDTVEVSPRAAQGERP